ncbi:Arginine/ornithine antiporter ArcD [hydrothermal vent metagenome]|uniref:Arginine/ornithine antiporter ArcD n=1 Tax=hydrothermal vent metagenome TaxID=652676 RepID=A0A3B0TQN9_9ZZZZ
MCLSASVSFTASGLLVVGGAFASWKAWNINTRYLPIGLMPVFAGTQQFFEGYVWVGMNAGDPATVLWSALGYIFFTWFMWPIWIPFSVYVLEPADSPNKIWFGIFTAIGTGFGILLYVPHLLNPDWVSVTINRDALAYEGTMLLDYMMPREITYLIYLFLIVVPPLMSRYLHVKYFGLTLIAIIAIDIALLRYAYISFFCLLAGLGTVHLIYIILRNKCARECPKLFA